MMIKALFRYLKVRGSEGSTWAGLSVLGLFLNQFTGYELDGLFDALREAVPAAVTGNWLGALIVILPAIVAIMKQDKPGDKDESATPQPQQMASAMPPGARPQPQPGGLSSGS